MKIEEVKEKETFKKACEILERFSEGEMPQEKSILKPGPQQQPQSANNFKQPLPQSQSQQNVSNANRGQTLNATILAQTPNVNRQTAAPPNSVAVDPHRTIIQTQPKNLPRPIVPQNRTTFDKLIDLFIGDGPNNRFIKFKFYQ